MTEPIRPIDASTVSEWDDEVDVVGRANVDRPTLHLVEEHHLATDQQPVVAELRGEVVAPPDAGFFAKIRSAFK